MRTLLAIILMVPPSPRQQVWLGIVVEPAVVAGIACAEVIAVVEEAPSFGNLSRGDCIQRVDGVPVVDLESLGAVHLKHHQGDQVLVELVNARSVSLRYDRLPVDASARACRATQLVAARVAIFVEGKGEERIRLPPGTRLVELRKRALLDSKHLPHVIVDRRACDGSTLDSLVGVPDSTELLDGDRVFFQRTSRLGCTLSIGSDGGFRCEFRR